MRRAWVLAVCLGVAGCAGGGSSDDPDAALPRADARADIDAPAPLPIDAALVPDAAFPDAAGPDAAGGPDAGSVDASIPTGPCDPIEQTGCGPGLKCGFVLDDPASGIGRTGCAVDGTATLGEACVNPSVAGASDTCAAGGHCYQGTCNEICTTVSDMCMAGSCANFTSLDFDVCLPSCDPIAQDCPGAGDACYLLPGGSVCAGVFMDTPPGGACSAANSCAAGAGCFGDPGVCQRFCGLGVCPPQLDDMGNVVAWCGPDAEPACDCSGGGPASGMECVAGQSCQGISGSDTIGVCADL